MCMVSLKQWVPTSHVWVLLPLNTYKKAFKKKKLSVFWQQNLEVPTALGTMYTIQVAKTREGKCAEAHQHDLLLGILLLGILSLQDSYRIWDFLSWKKGD